MALANVAESGTPKRVSVPSLAAPTAFGHGAVVHRPGRDDQTTMLPIARIAITATIA